MRAEAGAPVKDDDALILSTIHFAKGQERKAEQILNIVDGCISSSMSTGTAEAGEEERRLLHVAMKLAREQLQLLRAPGFAVWRRLAHILGVHADVDL